MPWNPPPPLAIPAAGEDALLEAAKRRKAEEEIGRKLNTLDGAPGVSTGDLMKVGIGFYRQYLHGRIYHYGSSAFYIYGAIGNKYIQLGGPESWLGWPTSDEQPFAQDGRFSTFEHGAIYWWPDTGAIELGSISVQYKGLYCFGETDEVSASDEPYVIFGVVPAPPSQSSEVMTQIYSDVDSGDSRPDIIELYQGLPYGAAIGVALMENDQGDPNKYLEQIKQGVAAAGTAVTTGCAAIPYVGVPIAIACAELWKEYGSDIVQFVNGIVGSGDDLVEKWVWNVTAKEMVTMARTPLRSFWGIDYHLESKLLSDGEASYKVYLAIHLV